MISTYLSNITNRLLPLQKHIATNNAHLDNHAYIWFDVNESAIRQTFLQFSHMTSPDDFRILACDDKSKDSLVPL